MPTLIECLRVLKRLEWAGTTEGQGGSMGTVGPLVKCCPHCYGVYPKDPHKNHFVKAAVGHKPTCPLAKVLQG